MSITDELREYAAHCAGGMGGDALRHIADRIDAEHDREMIEIRTRGWSNGYDEGFASADDWLAQHEDAMADHGWVKLPVDANGAPYHIDDKVDSDHYEDGTVVGIQYFKAPNGVVFEEIAVQPNGWDTATWRDPEEYRHHHTPTVEDVLREFADEVKRCCDTQDTIAEYAAKLRLAGDAE